MPKNRLLHRIILSVIWAITRIVLLSAITVLLITEMVKLLSAIKITKPVEQEKQ